MAKEKGFGPPIPIGPPIDEEPPPVPAAKRFQLLPDVGNHSEADITYSAGDMVSTNNDLVSMFPNKFTEVGAPRGEPKPKHH
jgi:hypothetical protein